MGGLEERIEVYMIAQWGQDPAQAREELMATFASFDAQKAQCFLQQDRERLLAVIEAGFGDFKEFNKLVRRIFSSRTSIIPATSHQVEGGVTIRA